MQIFSEIITKIFLSVIVLGKFLLFFFLVERAREVSFNRTFIGLLSRFYRKMVP